MVAAWLFYYWLASQAIMLCVLIGGRGEECQNGQRIALQSESWQVWCLLVLVNAVLAPVLLPWTIYTFVKETHRAQRADREFRRTFRELQLTPLHPLNIPEELAEHIDTHASLAVDHGFRDLGDYWLKEEPFNSKAKMMLAEDGTSILEIGIVLNTLYCELTSYLAEGTMIGTADCEIPRSAAARFAKYRFYVQPMPDADLAELIEQHALYVGTVAQDVGQPIALIDESNWKEFLHYHNARYGEIRFQLREIDAPPRPFPFPIPATSLL